MLRLFFMFIFLAVTSSINAQDKILWTESRKLVWDDFQSKVRTGNAGAAATTYCGISYLLSTTTKKFSSRQVKVESFFVPAKSWAHNDHKTDLVLMHEQSHFDIAELFARKFRKIINDKTLDATLLQKYYTDVYNDYRKYQQDYETITNHGRIREKQYEYSARIDSEIEKLGDFKT